MFRDRTVLHGQVQPFRELLGAGLGRQLSVDTQFVVPGRQTGYPQLVKVQVRQHRSELKDRFRPRIDRHRQRFVQPIETDRAIRHLQVLDPALAGGGFFGAIIQLCPRDERRCAQTLKNRPGHEGVADGARMHGIAAANQSSRIAGALPQHDRHVRIELIDERFAFPGADLFQAVRKPPQRLVPDVLVGVRPFVLNRLRC